MNVLEGIRVLELGRVPPLELPGMMLADMGADVIKIETPTSAVQDDQSRYAERRSHTNRNKRSVGLNLKHPAGRAAFVQLVTDADVIVEGFRPGVMQRLGLDHAALAPSHPRLVYCSMSGFGQTGPYRDRPAHDLNFLALSGALGLWGSGDTAPHIPLNMVADYGGAAMHAALAIMLALFSRESGGRGQAIDISYLDTTVALLAATPNLRQLFGAGHTPGPGEGVFCGGYPYYALYSTRDGMRLSVACSEPHLWRNFCQAIGHPELEPFARQPAHYRRAPLAEEARARLKVEQTLLERDCGQWMQLFETLDVCVAPVHDIAAMLQDPQIRARGTLTSVDHPEDGPIPQFASALRLGATPPSIRRAAPLSGEHTQEILTSLGLSPGEVESLRQQGAAM